MQSNRDRIKKMIEHISTFNDADPGEGISRFSYSENDAKARKYLIDICEDIGLKVRVDAVGNVFARLVGTDESLPVVMSGSHIDSVKNGGRFDGLVGSIGALEAVRVMVEEGYQCQRIPSILCSSLKKKAPTSKFRLWAASSLQAS